MIKNMILKSRFLKIYMPLDEKDVLLILNEASRIFDNGIVIYPHDIDSPIDPESCYIIKHKGESLNSDIFRYISDCAILNGADSIPSSLIPMDLEIAPATNLHILSKLDLESSDDKSIIYPCTDMNLIIKIKTKFYEKIISTVKGIRFDFALKPIGEVLNRYNIFNSTAMLSDIFLVIKYMLYLPYIMMAYGDACALKISIEYKDRSTTNILYSYDDVIHGNIIGDVMEVIHWKESH